MESRLKIGAMITGLTLGMTAFGLAGCADFDAITEQGIQERAKIRAQMQSSAPAMVAQADTGQSQPTQLIMPTDKRTAAAIDEAMPTIKKVLAIHQCVKKVEGLRQLNFYAVSGADMTHQQGSMYKIFPMAEWNMKYHDLNKCVSVKTLDQWTMPALNALQFRVVYFADDSGETVNFQYLFKKTDDGSWKIAQFERSN
jgi:hypothetical protein